MQPWLDKLYTKLEAKEATLAREKKMKDVDTTDTENDIKNHKTKMLATIDEKHKKIFEKYTKLKTSKPDEARKAKKESDELRNIATRINSSRGGTRRRRRGKGTRKNGF
jgi:hypothetical protein